MQLVDVPSIPQDFRQFMVKSTSDKRTSPLSPMRLGTEKIQQTATDQTIGNCGLVLRRCSYHFYLQKLPFENREGINGGEWKK